MTLGYKLFQIIRCAKVRIDIIEVLLPVTMVTPIGLFRDWRYQDGIYSETLNVIQFLNYSTVVTPTIIIEVLTWRTGITSFGKTICYDL